MKGNPSSKDPGTPPGYIAPIKISTEIDERSQIVQRHHSASAGLTAKINVHGWTATMVNRSVQL
ncbi:MAG: hypothetical protein ACQKBU_01690 [Verrucomicrobiales bacterium]